MSHFAVVVIGNNVAGQLAPYQENNMGDCPDQYMEFRDETEDVTNGWEEDTLTRVRLRATDGVEKTLVGTLVSPHDRDHFPPPKGEYHAEAPEDMERIEVPVKEIYASLEEYAKDYHGYEIQEGGENEGRFGYMHNPNCKWDWYVVGGRWSGYFPLKEGADGELGEPGVFNNRAEPQTADQALLDDIDLDRARNECETRARKLFAQWRPIFETHGRPLSWEHMRDELHKGDTNAARVAYREQPAIAAAEEVQLFGWGDVDPSDVGYDEEDYVRRERNGALVPYAVVKDGKWVGRGEMGWFGMSSGDIDEEDWSAQFQSLLNDLPPDTQVTMVDCHI